MRLTVRERERGWVIHSCSSHGPLMVGPPSASVRCGEAAGRGKRCNRVAFQSLDGTTPIPRQERARRAEPQYQGPQVYFIEGGGLIKVGFTTTTPEARLKALQNSTGQKLILIGSVLDPKAKKLENKLHRHWAEHRIHGEWFAADIRDEAMAFIRDASSLQMKG